MVSANVFETGPENRTASQCQAFVAKPVIESELLDTLGEHLHIEWSTEPTGLPLQHLLGQRSTDAEAIGAPRLTASDLPAEVVEELCRLARIGHLRALRQKLTQLAERYPQWQSEWVSLSHLADQFEFDTLIERLNPVISEDALDEPQA